MKRLAIRIDVEDDIILSANSSSAGTHHSLRYVPGRALLGYAAGHLYRSMQADRVARLLNAGSIRFGDGLPLTDDGQTAWPVPLSLHVPKDAPDSSRLSLARNLARGDMEPGQQPEQLRDTFVTDTGSVVDISLRDRLRTTVNPETGLALDGGLYGYAGIVRGQAFGAMIELHDSDEALLDAVQSLFDGVRTSLGRSRSTEYGRVTFSLLERAFQSPAKTEPADGPTLVWLLSDHSPRDAWGQRSLIPDPAQFGLPDDAEINWNRTFIRSRRYSPFNAALGGHQTETVCLEAGSVIAFDTPREQSAGMSRQKDGHSTDSGRFVINPSLLSDPDGNVSLAAHTRQTRKSGARPTEGWGATFAGWLERPGTGVSGAHAYAERQSARLKGMYASASRIEGNRVEFVGPGPSQWGRVYDAARRANSYDDLNDCLFVGDHRVCKGTDWDALGSAEERLVSFGQWLRDMLASDDGRDLHRVRLFAREARALAQRLQRQ